MSHFPGDVVYMSHFMVGSMFSYIPVAKTTQCCKSVAKLRLFHG